MADPTTEPTSPIADESIGDGTAETALAAAQAAGARWKPNADSLGIFKAAIGTPNFQNQRVECMDGDEGAAKIYNKGAYSVSPNASVGEVCRLVMERSADVERNPTLKAKYPDQRLLAPYAAIAADKGYGQNDQTALNALHTFVAAAYNPQYQQRSDKIELPLPNGNNLVMTPGVVLDAVFTQTVIDGLAGKPIPAPKFSEAQLANAAEACNYNAKDIATVGVCRVAGSGLGALYVQRVREAKVAAR